MGARTAVVIGASMGGLAFAEALSGSFDVVLIERDTLPTGVGARKGTPQARHPHVVLRRGMNALETLFPGISEEWVARGGVPVRVGETLGFVGPLGWGIPFSPALDTIAASRDFLESVVRDRVRKNARVTIRDGHDVRGLVGDARRVTGVRVRARDAEDAKEETLEADLVVDTSGRGSALAAWLEPLGVRVEAERSVDARVVYATTVGTLRAPLPHGWNAFFETFAPPSLRAGVVYPFEGGRVFLTIGTAGGERAPTNLDEMRAAARGLRSPIVSDVLATAEITEDVRVTRSTNNRIRSYDRAALPLGLLPVADALIAFNPIYGQGMTVAACQALVARDHFAQRGPSAPADASLRRRMAAVAKPALDAALGADRRIPNCEGAPPLAGERFLHRYTDAVFEACGTDAECAYRFSRVLHLVDEPTALFSPRMLRHALPIFFRGPRATPTFEVPAAWTSRAS